MRSHLRLHTLSKKQATGTSTVHGRILPVLTLFLSEMNDIRAYGNEREVGEGVKASGTPRSDIFVSFVLCALYSYTWKLM